MSNNKRNVTVVTPDARRGGTPSVKKKDEDVVRPVAEQYIMSLMTGASKDDNLQLIQSKVGDFHGLADTGFRGLKAAIENGDMDAVASVAHKMTQDTGKVGAIRMMRLCIAMQMLGRRGMLENANKLLNDLEIEYLQVKDGLISHTA